MSITSASLTCVWCGILAYFGGDDLMPSFAGYMSIFILTNQAIIFKRMNESQTK